MSGASKRRSPAFDAEVLDHLGTMKTASKWATPNQTDAEDLVQDTYLHALRSAERFTPGTNLKAWLRTILNNLAKNRRRDHMRARVQVNEPEVARAADTRRSGQASPEQVLLNAVIEPRLQVTLESMPKALRDAVWLRDVEEMSYADIARRMRVPLGTVMSRISRGRRLLHDRLLAFDREPQETGYTDDV